MLLDLLRGGKQAGSNKVLYKKRTCVGGRGDNKTLNRLISVFNRISIFINSLHALSTQVLFHL